MSAYRCCFHKSVFFKLFILSWSSKHRCLVNNLLCQPHIYIQPFLDFLKRFECSGRFGELHAIDGDLWELPQPYGFRKYCICNYIYLPKSSDHLTLCFASLWAPLLFPPFTSFSSCQSWVLNLFLHLLLPPCGSHDNIKGIRNIESTNLDENTKSFLFWLKVRLLGGWAEPSFSFWSSSTRKSVKTKWIQKLELQVEIWKIKGIFF